ncbi:MAG: TetR/AcrR family transcriptional regulator [Prevotella sp.]|nr:TetR/AcrR family transcriptional regulator [Prevotella sp.]
MELRNRILKAAMTEFLHKGVKSVKMDDIANTLAISKRTLYEIYSNKEELLLEAVRIHEQEFNDHMLQYSLDKNHNVMDIIIEFYKKKLLDIADVSPLFLVELRKYKQVVEYLEKQNAERHYNALLFFHRGVKEGFFRSDLNFDIILKTSSASVNYAMETQMYKNYSITAIMHNTIFLYLRGICTTKGIKELDAAIEQ